jgi:hypothetical protein
VYQYLDLSPARYVTVTGAEISFVIPQSWLDDHHLAPQDIVMYHRVGTTWQALPTRLVRSVNGQVYFTATSPGFSRFAITGQAGTTTGSFAAAPEQAPATGSPTLGAHMATGQPVVTSTTAVPSAQSVPKPGFPFMTIALIGAAGVVLAGSGFLIRRWWIRRQNPALFREYD